MNIHVNFEIAKLLKENRFNQIGNKLWHFNGSDCIEMVNKNSENFGFSAPTIAEVVMWLYEKHGIWIWVERYSTLFRPYAEEVGSERFGKWEGHKFDSPTEAYSGAINYTLKNLIK